MHSLGINGELESKSQLANHVHLEMAVKTVCVCVCVCVLACMCIIIDMVYIAVCSWSLHTCCKYRPLSASFPVNS